MKLILKRPVREVQWEQKIFDLTQYIDNPNSLGAEKIAELLKNKSWQ